MCLKSRFAVEGLQIYVNEQTHIPEGKDEVVPISSRSYSRKFMSSQVLYLFHSPEKRQQANMILCEKLQLAGISDFVTIDLNAGRKGKLFFHYTLNMAIQKYSKDELLGAISLLKGECHLDMQEDEFDQDNDYLHYLEQILILSLDMVHNSDSMEASSAEKLDSILGVQNWQITSIYKFGIFDTDPRYSRHMLLRELVGHDGNSPIKFVAFSESKQQERLKEIREQCQNCLEHTLQWGEFINCLMAGLENSKEKFKVLVDVYNPDSIVTALYFSLTKSTPDYLLLFLVAIDYPEQLRIEFYKGEVNGTGEKPKLKIFTSENEDEVRNDFLTFG